MELEQINKMLDELKLAGHNQAKVAANVGTSSSALSQIKKGEYKADPSPIIEKLVSFYNRVVDNTPATSNIKTIKVEERLPFIETITTKAIATLLMKTAKDSGFTVICGLSGAGKTTALKQYTSQHPETILMEVDETYTSKIFFSELSLLLGGDGIGTTHSLMNFVKKKLKDTEMCILVDEAENLNMKTVNLIRRMRDYSGVGLALVGTRSLKSLIESQRGSQTQIYTRVKDYMFIGGLKKPGEEFFGVPNADVENHVKSIFPDASKAIVNAYYKECNGNTRVLQNLLKRASDVYRGYEAAEKEIDFSHQDLIKQSSGTLLFKGLELM